MIYLLLINHLVTHSGKINKRTILVCTYIAKAMKSSSLLIITLVLICGIVFVVEGLTYLLNDSIEIEITSDKEVYHPDEVMNIQLSMESPRDIDGVNILIEGIKNSRDIYKVSRSYEKNITKGSNNITIEYITPSCSKCTGIDPGTYFINATVAYGDMALNATHNITIDI